MQNARRYTLSNYICMGVDQTMRSLFSTPKMSARPNPAKGVEEADLNPEEKKHISGLMRVNHAGEIAAQALYHGQACATNNLKIKEKMQEAAIEEGDHLVWCQERLNELNSHVSYFKPLWYMGSFVIGVTAGLAGDKWSLGFLAETEKQVSQHLKNHLKILPAKDIKSQRILEQMQVDEEQHREDAIRAGAAELPEWVKTIMRFTSKIMVKTAYWV